MNATPNGKPLRNASVAVYRAIARRPGGRAVADPSTQFAGTWQMLLAESPTPGQLRLLPRWRGRLDALALRARLSDAMLHERFAPSDASARKLYSLLEQNRVEALGSRRYAGMRANLAALAQERWVRARPEAANRSSDTEWVETFALLARMAVDAPLPREAQEAIASSMNSWMTSAEARAAGRLSRLLDDQAAYALQSLQVIAALFAPANDAQPPSLRPEQQRSDDECDPRSAAIALQPASAATAGPRQPASNAAVAASEDLAGVPVPGSPLRGYRIFTTEFDRVVRAQDLADADALMRGRIELDRLIGNRLANVRRWAHRLQRKLLGLQMRTWQFDRDEGELDGSRLTRVATHPLESLVYKTEAPVKFPDTTVCLLVDNSGSMRGLPIATAAVCAELLGRVLERCGVETEILGFTTRSWRGGQSFRQWSAAGREDQPGRLNELLHIVYKNADEPWRRAHLNMGAMLHADVLKENVDGEALLWAHERLLRRPASRKILLVISDGAPLEDATLQANDVGYLDRHLRAVIDAIDNASLVELVAIGIGHDASRFYRRATNVRDADSLGEALVTELLELFDKPPRARRPSPRPISRALQ